MARKKLNPLQQAYQKEYNRLRKGFSRYQKQGYYFPEESIKKTPKRVTQQMLQSIKQIKPEQLTIAATKVDIETGEITQLEKKKSLKKISTTKIKRISKPKDNEIKIDKPDYGVQLPPKIEEPDDVHFDTPYYPTLDILDAIRDRINELPDVTRHGKGVHIAGRRGGLLRIFEDNISYAELTNSLADYIDFLKQNEGKIISELDHVPNESTDEQVRRSFSTLAELLNGGQILSPEQGEEISFMQELYY